MQLISVYACVRVISEALASLPFPVYREDGMSRVKASDDPRFALLNEAPNPEMYAMELWEQVVGWANLQGSGYVFLVRDNRGEVVELWPLPGNRVQRVRSRSNELLYRLRFDNGDEQLLDKRDVVEIRAFMGLSPIRKVARDEIAAGLAQNEYGQRFWANSARPDGIVEYPHRLEDDEYEEFRARWNAGHQGVRRSHLVGLLTNGAKWNEVGVPPAEAQFLESKKYTARQIASLYRVPPYKIGDMEPGSVSYASVEVQQMEFVVDSLRPWLVRTEQAVRNRVFNTDRDRRAGVYPEFKVEGLLRGDTLSRYRAYAIGIQWGFMNRSQPRELENWDYHPELDEFLVPMNMTEAGAVDGAVDDVVAAARANGVDDATLAVLAEAVREQLQKMSGRNGIWTP
jgi:HK97 family phage portal protein